jgi:hypothetical protein
LNRTDVIRVQRFFDFVRRSSNSQKVDTLVGVYFLDMDYLSNFFLTKLGEVFVKDVQLTKSK